MRLAALLATFFALVSTVSVAAPVGGQGTWETSLKARDLDEDNVADAYYDTALDVTWLRNAGSGPANWSAANLGSYYWNFGGVAGWRMPGLSSTIGVACGGLNWGYSGTICGFNVDTSSSELAHLWYVTLGNVAYVDQSGQAGQGGWGLSNTGPFDNLYASIYWTGAEYSPTIYQNDPRLSTGWTFNTATGMQSPGPDHTTMMYTMSVHDGDVGVALVPEPGSGLLSASALAAAVAAAFRRSLRHQRSRTRKNSRGALRTSS